MVNLYVEDLSVLWGVLPESMRANDVDAQDEHKD